MPTVSDIAADLAAEHADLDQMLASLSPEAWARDTPSPGWTIADQVGHLAYFDRTAASAITEPEVFQSASAALLGAMAQGRDITLDEPRTMSPNALLTWWREGRSTLLDAAGKLGESTRVPWYGPEMSGKSFLTARLMETWAHGQDIADTVGTTRAPTDRIRHIAQLGYLTRGWSHAIRGMDHDVEPVRLTLTAPSGTTWTWGDKHAPESVAGSAEAFCQVVTQRRHVDDTDLVVVGDNASQWMTIAQAFAGGATDGPTAGNF